MARGHEVQIGADGREFNQALKKDIIKPVEDAAKALDDLGDEGKESGRKLEDALRDASRATENLDRSIEKSGANVEKFGSNARDELRDSAREGVASWNGEMSDIGDVLQEASANLGPAGMAGAAVIGALGAVATAAVEAWNEKVQGIKDATADMWQSAAEEGQAFIDGEAVRAEAQRIIWDEAYEENMRAAESAGVSRAEFAIALAQGEGEAFDRVHQQIMDARAEEQAAASASLQASTDGNVALQDATAVVNSELARTVSILDEKAAATDRNKGKAQEAAAAEQLLEEETRAQIDRTASAAQKRYEGLAAQFATPLSMTIGVDDTPVSAALNKLREMKRLAENGVTVNMKTVNGRQLLP